MAQTRSLPRSCIALGLADVPTARTTARREAWRGETFLESAGFPGSTLPRRGGHRGFLAQSRSIVIAIAGVTRTRKFNGAAIEEQQLPSRPAIKHGAQAIDYREKCRGRPRKRWDNSVDALY